MQRLQAGWARAGMSDGLVDVGVLPDDDAAHLEGPDMRLGTVHPRGRLVLTITEVSPP
jgi:hypothetical protein